MPDVLPALKLPVLPDLSRLLACHDCDALYEAPELREGESIVCEYCGAKLLRFRKNSLHRSAAFTISAAVLFLVANCFPFIDLSAAGQGASIRLSQSVVQLEAHGTPWLAAGVAIFILAAPAVAICGMLYVLLPLLQDRKLPGAIPISRLVYRTDPWNMIEVFLLGVLVSLLKLGDIAKVTLDTGFWAFAGLIVCLTAALSSIDRRELWLRLEALEK